MQLRAYAVADKFPYHRVTASFDILLHRGADIADAVARLRSLDSLARNRLSRVASIKLLCFFGNLAAREGPCVVSVESLIDCANVNADDVALFEDSRVLKVCRG